MSLFGRVAGGIAGAILGPIGGAIGGPVGATIGTAIGSAIGGATSARPRVMPGVTQAAAVMPMITAAGRAVGTTLFDPNLVVQWGRAVGIANAYCRRNPVLCSTIAGGVPALADMIARGKVPSSNYAVRRRRGKGFTGKDVRQAQRMFRMLRTLSAACPPKPSKTNRSAACR